MLQCLHDSFGIEPLSDQLDPVTASATVTASYGEMLVFLHSEREYLKRELPMSLLEITGFTVKGKSRTLPPCKIVQMCHDGPSLSEFIAQPVYYQSDVDRRGHYFSINFHTAAYLLRIGSRVSQVDCFRHDHQLLDDQCLESWADPLTGASLPFGSQPLLGLCRQQLLPCLPEVYLPLSVQAFAGLDALLKFITSIRLPSLGDFVSARQFQQDKGQQFWQCMEFLRTRALDAIQPIMNTLCEDVAHSVKTHQKTGVMGSYNRHGGIDHERERDPAFYMGLITKILKAYLRLRYHSVRHMFEGCKVVYNYLLCSEPMVYGSLVFCPQIARLADLYSPNCAISVNGIDCSPGPAIEGGQVLFVQRARIHYMMWAFYCCALVKYFMVNRRECEKPGGPALPRQYGAVTLGLAFAYRAIMLQLVCPVLLDGSRLSSLIYNLPSLESMLSPLLSFSPPAPPKGQIAVPSPTPAELVLAYEDCFFNPARVANKSGLQPGQLTEIIASFAWPTRILGIEPRRWVRGLPVEMVYRPTRDALSACADPSQQQARRPSHGHDDDDDDDDGYEDYCLNDDNDDHDHDDEDDDDDLGGRSSHQLSAAAGSRKRLRLNSNHVRGTLFAAHRGMRHFVLRRAESIRNSVNGDNRSRLNDRELPRGISAPNRAWYKQHAHGWRRIPYLRATAAIRNLRDPITSLIEWRHIDRKSMADLQWLRSEILVNFRYHSDNGDDDDDDDDDETAQRYYLSQVLVIYVYWNRHCQSTAPKLALTRSTAGVLVTALSKACFPECGGIRKTGARFTLRVHSPVYYGVFALLHTNRHRRYEITTDDWWSKIDVHFLNPTPSTEIAHAEDQ